LSAPRAGGTDRGLDAQRGPDRAPAAVPAIALLLLAGLALRLIIAYALFPGSGFETDVNSFSSWAWTLAQEGPGRFYETAGFADYVPGYLYVLWLIGLAGQLGNTLAGIPPFETIQALLKLPAILMDIAVAYLMYRVVLSWGHADRGDHARRARVGRAALIVAALYVLNPVTWYDSALWAQVDSFGAMVMLLTVIALVSGYSEAAVGLTVLAGLLKPQYAVVLLPVVGVILLRRHLFAPGSGPRPRLRPGRFAEWFADEQGPWRLVSSAAVGLAMLVVLILPFNLDLFGLMRIAAGAAGEYNYLSVNAYNPWALVGAGGTPSIAESGLWSEDTLGLLGPIPGVAIGVVLLAIGFAVGVAHLALRDGRRAIVLGLVFFALAFFVLPTRVHERYLFPAFVFMPLLAIASGRWRIATIVLACATLVNFHAILTIPLYGTPNVDDLAGGALFRSQPFVTAAALASVAVFALALWEIEPIRRLVARLRGRFPPEEEHELGEEPALGDLPPPGPAEAEEGVLAAGVLAAGVATAGAEGQAVVAAPAAEPPAARARLRFPLPGPLRVSLDARSARADRTALLAREPGGRLDRLDLLIVALIVVGALTLRTWRLDEPKDMYFDEVYHARTATEFLQDWRYGIPHDIYEFTHPHLAKYLIAGGLVAFGNDRVTGESSLGASVEDAAIERSWSPPKSPSVRNGDRLYVATGSEVGVYDLEGRGLAATITVPGATALALDPFSHVLFVGASDGSLWRIDTGLLDDARLAGETGPDLRLDATSLEAGGAEGRVEGLTVASGGSVLVAQAADGSLVSVDPVSGAVFGRAGPSEVAGIVALDATDRLVVDVAALADPQAGAARVAEALGEDPERLSRLFATEPRRVAVAAFLDADRRAAVGAALADLPAAAIEAGGVLAVSGDDAVRFLDAETLDELMRVDVSGDGPVGGLALVRNDKPRLYVAAGPSLQVIDVEAGKAPAVGPTVRMPNQVTDVRWDEATNLVHALGATPDGSGSTVYVVEPNGNAVFADARLPFTPAAWLIDEQPDRPSADRQEVVALAGDGMVAVIDAGSHAFAWRLPGVIAGALMGAFLYLLARVLFRRRLVALLVALIGLLDGMFFANARIAMNDTYEALFIVAAITVFAALYLGRWRGRSALLFGLPLLGVLLGLALATKWVGLYAIGAVVLLVLLRSALGRLIALAAMVGMSGILGYLAISHAPEVLAPQTNYLFLLLMAALTFLLAAAIVIRPVRFTLEEVRFGVGAPLVLGAALGFAAMILGGSLPAEGLITREVLLAAGFGLVLLSGLFYLAVSVGRRLGVGPLAAPAGPDDSRALLPPPSEPPDGWLLPGAGLGAPFAWALVCLTVIPLVVYVASYIPWLALGNQLVAGFPPGNTGQTFIDLQRSMYEYHDNLRATHAASSPWWAWPLNLKPVWFQQGGYANDTASSIYDTGNLVLFWLSIPAAAWAAWQAWRRRSLALTLVVIAAACLWLPWTRIDRATFQYHYFTALPFVFLALAYFLAELWHGPSGRTWVLARVAAAVALLGPPLLWLLKAPLCALAGTARVAPNSQACGSVVGSLVVTERVAATVLILAIGAGALLWQLRLHEGDGGEAGGSSRTRGLWRSGWLLLTAALTLVALVVAQARFGETPVISSQLGNVGPLLIAAVVGVLLLAPAWLILGARDPRRFVVGAVVAAGLWFVVFYPNISALPLPGLIVNSFQGLLPTWIYDLQFAVNTDPPASVPLLGRDAILLTGMIGVATLAVMYATWTWRLELAVRRASRVGGSTAGPPAEPGTETGRPPEA
jgi:hypothetical protein